MIPFRFLGQKEISCVHSKPDRISTLSNEMISKRLKGLQVEGGCRRDMRYSQSEMVNGHVVVMIVVGRKQVKYKCKRWWRKIQEVDLKDAGVL